MIKILLISTSFFLISCTTEPLRMYNYDLEQDGQCYGKYGGQWGYCDKVKDGK